MLWGLPEYRYDILQKLCMYLVKFGPIPKHVAIIMDGNRRFAASRNMHCSSGHTEGFSKLSETLRWCYDLGVEELSVFAFSVENFNRSQEEISFLFDLAAEKLQELIDKSDTLSSMGVCVRIIGDITMLPTRIQRIASEMMLKTRHNTRLFLNICMAYGGQNELTDAAERIRLGVRNKVLHPSDVNPDLLSQCLYTGHSRPLDLFIRSSGEVRLSDFLVWQAAHSGVVHKFVESYWPNFSLWDLLGAILHYQLTLLQMSRLNPSSPYQATGSSSGSTQRAGVGEKHRTLRIRRFLSQLDRSHWADLEKRSLSFQAPSNTEPRIIQRSVGDSLLS
ncbi:Dehydrodolichyl diphosphate synthase complex subunit dhdds [Clonorchis sinensis]|uniref:Alkyl transferase n=1 Tax=Clonorchis sinensis TaxID=79923 RepID=A0A8T1M382_CLOSI|nr:Dehydrodolichyl diphosphate synthase complex subunit dhdds [Clonorchis sinensis]